MTSRSSVLVVGGAGYIGSHTCKTLHASGFAPVVYDNISTGHQDFVQWGPLIEADVRDQSKLTAAIAQHSPIAVIHFAACAYVGESVADPAKYYNNNVVGMQVLLEACREADINNIIFSSSCATYGVPDLLPIRETAAQHPINPYGRTKLICEQMLKDYADAYGTRFVALRYFNACGADLDCDVGERHAPETHLVPLALIAAYGQGPALNVFGDDYDTPDGTCVRDYVHVADLATAHVKALQHLLAGRENLCVNIGTGRGQSILDIIQGIERVTGRHVPHKMVARRPGDPPILIADPSLAARSLNFKPEFSDLDVIIRTAATYMRQDSPQEITRGPALGSTAYA